MDCTYLSEPASAWAAAGGKRAPPGPVTGAVTGPGVAVVPAGCGYGTKRIWSRWKVGCGTPAPSWITSLTTGAVVTPSAESGMLTLRQAPGAMAPPST